MKRFNIESSPYYSATGSRQCFYVINVKTVRLKKCSASKMYIALNRILSDIVRILSDNQMKRTNNEIIASVTSTIYFQNKVKLPRTQIVSGLVL